MGTTTIVIIVGQDRWLTPIILTTQEAEIRITVQSQSQANSLQDLISKIPNTEKGLVELFKW
jgi:hypothetical protein